VDWVGFSNADLPTALAVAGNVSNFPKLVDRTQQGFIDFMYLARAMAHAEDGFGSNPAFQVDPDGAEGAQLPRPVYDAEDLVYDGNSQGGILGGALTAVAPDYERAALGVPGMNYATLIQRSTDFATFSAILNPAYPDELERPLVYSLMQMLWDRGEPSGYAQHMTDDPLPNTPEHTVLMQVALGDFQVSNYEAEVEARTIGASIEHPTFDPGRYWDPSLEPFGIPAIGSFPYSGSAIQYFDGGPVGFTGTIGGGTGLPPLGNVPPVPGPTAQGSDPHSYPRRSAPAQDLKNDFWGGSISGCGGPCYSNGYTGSP
jgi:hypothetical protein